jgi:hypothetical protein
MTPLPTSWTSVLNNETSVNGAGAWRPTLHRMSTTMLTKRRAVDHCLVRSAMCRMS